MTQRVAHGAVVTLTVVWPADAADTSLTMLTPGGLVLAGFPVVLPAVVHDATGVYHYAWLCPGAAPVGDYTALWEGTPGGVATTKVESVTVHAVETAYLTVADLREFVESPLPDTALQLLLNAAYDEVVKHAGPVGYAIETCDGGSAYAFLRRQASAISTVVETVGSTVTTLTAADWALRGDGYSLRRLPTGTTTRPLWGDVIVTYTPLDDTAERKRVQLALVSLDLNTHPGLTEQRIGDWSEKYAAATASTATYAQDRQDILDSLPRAGAAPGFA